MSRNMVGFSYIEGLDFERGTLCLGRHLSQCLSPLAQVEVGVFVLGLKVQNTNLSPNALRDKNCMKYSNRK